MIDLEMLAVCTVTGCATFGIALLVRDDFRRGVQIIEVDLEKRLRSLRIRPQNLHRSIMVWLGLAATVFLSIGTNEGRLRI